MQVRGLGWGPAGPGYSTLVPSVHQASGQSPETWPPSFAALGAWVSSGTPVFQTVSPARLCWPNVQVAVAALATGMGLGPPSAPLPLPLTAKRPSSPKSGNLVGVSKQLLESGAAWPSEMTLGWTRVGLTGRLEWRWPPSAVWWSGVSDPFLCSERGPQDWGPGSADTALGPPASLLDVAQASPRPVFAPVPAPLVTYVLLSFGCLYKCSWSEHEASAVMR